jgi:hypothetical protein
LISSRCCLRCQRKRKKIVEGCEKERKLKQPFF